MRVALKFDVPCQSADDALFDRALSLLSGYELHATVFLSFGDGPRPWRPGLRSGWAASALRDRVERLKVADHELAASANSPTRWRSEVLRRDADWVRKEVRAACERFHSISGRMPAGWASPGQQINADVPLVEAEVGFRYACDTRGLTPFLPQTIAGRSSCPQIPVTLPGFNELRDAGIAESEWDQYLFMESQKPLLAGHVFQCDLAGCDITWLDILERLIVMWKGSQWDFVTLGGIASGLGATALPCHHIGILRLGGTELPTQGPQCQQ